MLNLLPLKIKNKIADKLLHFRINYEVLLKDKNEKIIKRQKDLAKSFAPNFLQQIYAGFSNWSSTNFAVSSSPYNGRNDLIQIDGSTHTNVTSWVLNIDSLTSNSNSGIICSSDNSTPSPQSFTLSGIITHGTGAGQLSYNNQQGTGITFNGNQFQITLTRTFTNLSGADVIVKKFYIVNNGTNRYKFFEELLGSPVTVSNNQTLTIIVTITLTI